MRRVPLIALLAAGVAITVVIVIAAIGILTDDAGGGDDVQRSGLEQSIIEQLPGQLAKYSGSAAQVRQVRCVEVRDSRYDCVAQTRVRGESGATAVAITASCDSGGCVWHAQESLGYQPSASEESEPIGREELPLLDPETGEPWGSVTCGEVEEAAASRDAAWLDAAGHAVAEVAIAELPMQTKTG